jgi:hypothetical protein
MRNITRNLRFEDGELDSTELDDGWRNWRIIAVLDYHQARATGPRVEYLSCLIEDRT